jgi:hypothetical protein
MSKSFLAINFQGNHNICFSATQDVCQLFVRYDVLTVVKYHVRQIVTDPEPHFDIRLFILKACLSAERNAANFDGDGAGIRFRNRCGRGRHDSFSGI